MEKHEALKTYFGHDSFRQGQEDLVDGLISGRDVLGVMPTGAGKSVCYQVPAMVLGGITLVISPLISLMKDQVASLKSAGIPAAYLNSSLTSSQLELAITRARQGAYRIIYVAPERLESYSFITFAKESDIRLIAVDEAHCVSQWGQDFRPNYLKIAAFVSRLPKRPCIGAFTATATERVREDIIRYLELRDPVCITTGFDRPNLFFDVRIPDNKDRALLGLLAKEKGNSGIVYCSTRKNVEDVTDLLNSHGYQAARYHAGLSDAERAKNQEDFQFDRVQIIVATNAFGMGIDKSNVRFVIHYNMPASMEAYYQEAGRAGRDGAEARCTLLFSFQDVIIGRWMIQNGSGNADLPEEEREKIKQQDLIRLRKMADYAQTSICLRERILQYFGQKTNGPCGNCGTCKALERARTAHADPWQGERGHQESAASYGGGLDGPMPLPMKKLKLEKEAPPEEKQDEPVTLLTRLRACRMTLSQGLRVPPYIICDDKTLEDMAAKMPLTQNALLQVSGMGVNKVGKYGEAFLAVIREWREKHPELSGTCRAWKKEEIDMMERGLRAGVKYEQLAEMFQTEKNEIRRLLRPIRSQVIIERNIEHGERNRGEKWNEYEDEQLKREFQAGCSISEMAKKHQRNNGGIEARLKKLGLIE